MAWVFLGFFSLEIWGTKTWVFRGQWGDGVEALIGKHTGVFWWGVVQYNICWSA